MAPPLHHSLRLASVLEFLTGFLPLPSFNGPGSPDAHTISSSNLLNLADEQSQRTCLRQLTSCCPSALSPGPSPSLSPSLFSFSRSLARVHKPPGPQALYPTVSSVNSPTRYTLLCLTGKHVGMEQLRWLRHPLENLMDPRYGQRAFPTIDQSPRGIHTCPIAVPRKA